MIREELYRFLLDRPDPKVAEIGVFRGNFADTYIPSLPNGKFWLIDDWKKHNHYKAQEKNLEYVKYKYGENPAVTIIVSDSLSAVKNFPDGFFDWVFIDGSHDYKSVKADIIAWKPKCKFLFSGHDYVLRPLARSLASSAIKNEVKKAVDELLGRKVNLTDETILKSWYVLCS